MPKKVNKRRADEENNFENDLSSCLQDFGSDLKKARQSKSEMIKQSTEESLQTTLNPLMDLLEEQAMERREVSDKFYDGMTNLLKQEEKDLQKAEKNDRDMQRLVRLQKKTAQKIIQFESENFEDLKQTSEKIFQNLDDLHQTQMQQLTELGNTLYDDLSRTQERAVRESLKRAATDMKNNTHFSTM